jgi:chemotaxis methyl-accepting protein methylase
MTKILSKESQQQIPMNFCNASKDGRYLITGKSKILTGEPYRKTPPIDQQARVYQNQPKKMIP